MRVAEVSIDGIQRELSCFDGPSDSKRQVVKDEEEDAAWEPPLWKQQYENVRVMRSKRDAPVDKYGCFMNAEKEVSPEVLTLNGDPIQWNLRTCWVKAFCPCREFVLSLKNGKWVWSSQKII